jgi:hypothetical protein
MKCNVVSSESRAASREWRGARDGSETITVISAALLVARRSRLATHYAGFQIAEEFA